MVDVKFPFWRVFATLRVRNLTDVPRPYLALRTGSKERAKLCARLLGVGRVKDGTVVVEGRAMVVCLKKLDFPESITTALEAFFQSRRELRRGKKTDPAVAAMLRTRVELLKAAIREEMAQIQ